jgi:hypothetical protein
MFDLTFTLALWENVLWNEDLLTQAKSFINYFHEAKSEQIALQLNNEQWIQADRYPA